MKFLTVKLSTQDIARFFSKVEVDRVSGCWNWKKKTDKDGYGNFRYNGNLERCHRVTFAWVNGPIPRVDNRTSKRKHIPQIDHAVCRNRRCCNPAHLELVTPRVNFLRGVAPNAVKAQSDYCPRGHMFTETAKVEKIGQGRTTRRCEPCRVEQQHQAYLNRKARGYYS